MSYYVSCVRSGKVHRFAYPHVSLDTAIGFACEILRIECGDVWISDETGQRIADKNLVAEYADEFDES